MQKLQSANTNWLTSMPHLTKTLQSASRDLDVLINKCKLITRGLPYLVLALKDTLRQVIQIKETTSRLEELSAETKVLQHVPKRMKAARSLRKQVFSLPQKLSKQKPLMELWKNAFHDIQETMKKFKASCSKLLDDKLLHELSHATLNASPFGKDEKGEDKPARRAVVEWGNWVAKQCVPLSEKMHSLLTSLSSSKSFLS
jgi:hypothetical protein